MRKSRQAHRDDRRLAATPALGSARRNRSRAHRCRSRFREQDRSAATSRAGPWLSVRGCEAPPARNGGRGKKAPRRNACRRSRRLEDAPSAKVELEPRRGEEAEREADEGVGQEQCTTPRMRRRTLAEDRSSAEL